MTLTDFLPWIYLTLTVGALASGVNMVLQWIDIIKRHSNTEEQILAELQAIHKLLKDK